MSLNSADLNEANTGTSSPYLLSDRSAVSKRLSHCRWVALTVRLKFCIRPQLPHAYYMTRPLNPFCFGNCNYNGPWVRIMKIFMLKFNTDFNAISRCSTQSMYSIYITVITDNSLSDLFLCLK
jgi:hypothetical protein